MNDLIPDSGRIEYNGVLDGIVGGLVFEYGSGAIEMGHAVLVPEPATLSVLALGGLLFLCKKKRR